MIRKWLAGIKLKAERELAWKGYEYAAAELLLWYSHDGILGVKYGLNKLKLEADSSFTAYHFRKGMNSAISQFEKMMKL